MLAFLLGVTSTLLAVQTFSSWGWRGQPSELHPLEATGYRVDLNRADRVELLQLPGIGEATAQRIEEHRDRTGGFQSIEDLNDVPGIGPARVEKLKGWVRVEDAPVTPPARVEERPRKITDPGERININEATAEELQRLPGIGTTLSQRIVEARQRGPFRSVDDLRRVPGIGAKTLERVRPHVTTGNLPIAAPGVN
jgi:competence protein ComEA